MDLQRFINTRLEVERTGDNQHYQLNDVSVSPTVLLDSDEDGIPREMTICAYSKVAQFVDRGGNICDIPLRTGRVPSNEPEAVMYEQIVAFDLIRAGQLPLAACPYTLDYGHFKPGPLVKPPEKFVIGSCKGDATSPMGCVHMKAIIEKRRADQVTRTEKNAKTLEKQMVSTELAKQFFAAMTEGLGEQLGNAIQNAVGARKGLTGRGEQ